MSNDSFSAQNEMSNILNNSLNSSIAQLVNDIDRLPRDNYLFKNIGYDTPLATPLASLLGSRKNSEADSSINGGSKQQKTTQVFRKVTEESGSILGEEDY